MMGAAGGASCSILWLIGVDVNIGGCFGAKLCMAGVLNLVPLTGVVAPALLFPFSLSLFFLLDVRRTSRRPSLSLLDVRRTNCFKDSALELKMLPTPPVYQQQIQTLDSWQFIV